VMSETPTELLPEMRRHSGSSIPMTTLERQVALTPDEILTKRRNSFVLGVRNSCNNMLLNNNNNKLRNDRRKDLIFHTNNNSRNEYYYNRRDRNNLNTPEIVVNRNVKVQNSAAAAVAYGNRRTRRKNDLLF